MPNMYCGWILKTNLLVHLWLSPSGSWASLLTTPKMKVPEATTTANYVTYVTATIVVAVVAVVTARTATMGVLGLH